MPSIFELAKTEARKQAEKRKALADDSALEDEDHMRPVQSSQSRETTLLIAGSPTCGKSSLLSRLVDKSQADVSGQSGVALEYAYATRTRNNIRDFAHIWELCGGGSLASLLEVPISEKNISNVSVVLFLDLTKPEEYQRVIEPLLTTVRRRLDHVLKALQDRQPLLRDKIIANARQKFDGHVDKRIIEPICIPFIIVGAKYDEFQHFDTDRKRTISRFLRFLAHINGASFVMYSSNNENLVNRGRSLLSHLAFNTSLNRTVSTDVQGPINVPAGADTIESIGSFGATTSMIASYKEAMEQWYYALNERFPQKPSETSQAEDPSMDSQFAEPLIDNLVEQKRRELELYIKEKRDRNAAEERTNQRAL